MIDLLQKYFSDSSRNNLVINIKKLKNTFRIQ